MLLFDGQVQRDTHVIPMGNYVIAFGASGALCKTPPLELLSCNDACVIPSFG